VTSITGGIYSRLVDFGVSLISILFFLILFFYVTLLIGILCVHYCWQ
jgi:hypothetical protein